MESKYTKGEWRIDSYNDVVDTNNQKIRVTGLVLAGHISEEVQANTKLIAAAPELLEALKKCASYIFHNCNGDYEKTVWRDAVNAIEKAIK